jgi:hypothetical protein
MGAGDQAIVMADTHNTHGSLTVIELTNQPHVSEGGMAFGPRGMPDCFQNVGTAPARLLIITTPAVAEQHFEAFAQLLPGPIDPEALAALALESGIELLGPPLSVTDPL